MLPSPVPKNREVALRWDSDSEAMIYSSSGCCLQAFTGGGGADRRDTFVFTEDFFSKLSQFGSVTFYVEMACNGMFGNGNGGMIFPPDDNRRFTLKTADLVEINTIAQALYWDVKVLYDLSTQLEDGPVACQAAAIANVIINNVNIHDDSSLNHARLLAGEILRPSDKSKQGCRTDHSILALGHCHIDTAWLWPYAETRRKVVRSWCTQASLLEKYPEWQFVASQTVQWEWLEADQPELFARIQQLVRTKRFVPTGGTFVEFDANVPSGESMIRQFLYGLEYFEKKLETSTKIFWLPDTFGYSGQLPQIMKGFDIPYFVTQKLSWNLINKFPYTTFQWEGVDGSTVLAHLPPANTYIAKGTVEELLRSMKNHKSLYTSNRSLLLFGHGDGGGGPAPSHLEQLNRFTTCMGLPRVDMVSTAESFFENIETSDFHSSVNWLGDSRKGLQVQRWVGELYLELHQGTLTSQAKLKKQNRQCEQLFRCVEALLATVAQFSRFSSSEDATIEQFKCQLKKLWKDLLLNQFHDVLPGSSIGVVYQDSDRMLTDVLRKGSDLEQELLQVCREEFAASITNPEHTGLIFNPTSFDLKCIPAFGFGFAASTQEVSKGTCSLRVDAETSRLLLENAFLKVALSRSGAVLSVLDKRCSPPREVIEQQAGGFGNRLMLYDDVPFYWDAWDVFPYHSQTGGPINGSDLDDCVNEVLPVEDAPAVAASFVLRRFYNSKSSLRQTIRLAEGSSMLEFECEVEWHEEHKLLKVEFPLAVRSTHAAYEIQCGGLVYRPTHNNTPFDSAMFEVCAQRFADLSEPGYGVALLNDCKYGYSCKGSTLCLSLLRSPKSPDPNCDMGSHRFRYALFPHLGGSVLEGAVVRAATLFNSSPVCFDWELAGPVALPHCSASVEGLVSVTSLHDALVIDALKLAENSTKDVIVRLVECGGSRGMGKLKTNSRIQRVEACNLKEAPLPSQQQVVTIGENEVLVSFKPFEILTLRFSLE